MKKYLTCLSTTVAGTLTAVFDVKLECRCRRPLDRRIAQFVAQIDDGYLFSIDGQQWKGENVAQEADEQQQQQQLHVSSCSLVTVASAMQVLSKPSIRWHLIGQR